MIEPCKEAKCISYPICMGKPLSAIYDCDTLRDYLNNTYRIVNNVHTPERADQLWNHMKSIFPRFRRKGYKFD